MLFFNAFLLFHVDDMGVGRVGQVPGDFEMISKKSCFFNFEG